MKKITLYSLRTIYFVVFLFILWTPYSFVQSPLSILAIQLSLVFLFSIVYEITDLVFHKWIGIENHFNKTQVKRKIISNLLPLVAAHLFNTFIIFSFTFVSLSQMLLILLLYIAGLLYFFPRKRVRHWVTSGRWEAAPPES